MPNDPHTYNNKQVCGLWVFGFDDIRAPYIWSACARFIFCNNFKDGKGSKVSAFQGLPDSFLVIMIDKNHKA